MIGNVQILGKVPEMSGPNRADNTDNKPNQCPHRHSEAKAEEEKQMVDRDVLRQAVDHGSECMACDALADQGVG